jgi:hypothetical protein
MKVISIILLMVSLPSLRAADSQINFETAQFSVGYLARSDKTPAVRHEAFLILCDWILHDDAEFRIPVDELLKLAENDPQSFYTWMTDSQTGSRLCNEWLSSIQTSSFTGGYVYDDLTEMEARRKRLIEVFSKQTAPSAKGNDLRLAIIKTLKGIIVSKVE